ncbi:MAG: ATP-binding protein [Bryobacteraceae bacterium]
MTPGNAGRSWGLRLRLSLVFVAFLFITILGLGLLFRQAMSSLLYSKTQDVLAEEWAAIKGFIRVRGPNIRWSYNPADPEEAAIVRRLQRLLLITDINANVIQVSDEFRLLSIDPRSELARARAVPGVIERVVSDRVGRHYLLRSGTIQEIGGNQFLLSAARPLFNEEAVVQTFTKRYFALAPILIVAMSLVAWWAAGRALEPLRTVAETAESITADNLSVAMPRRGADDELDLLIDAFNGMVARLEAAFVQMRQFTADASHELRTPLTTMRGQLEVALMTAETPEQLREAIGGAIEDIDRLGKVVRTLLQLSQAEAGQLQLHIETVDLGELARGVVERFAPIADFEDRRLTVRCARGQFIDGDRLQVDRLLSNLVSNALKYTPAGGAIHVSVNGREKRVELEVRDTGKGIAAEHLPHVFDRFFRVPDGETKPEKGLGLGLSFVAWIAKAHGATVAVESQLGAGATFRVRFPRAMAPIERPAPAAPESSPVGDRIEA